MKWLPTIVLTTLFITAGPCVGQQSSGLYLEAQNPVPNDILEHTYSKYEKAVEKNVSKKELKKIRQEQEKVLLNAAYELEYLFASGDVLFGDSITGYLNDIKNIIFADQEIRSKVRIYLFKSPEANAFTHPNGAIFVTTGLMEEIETEDELALIIAHEVGHYALKHTLNSAKKLIALAEERENKLDAQWFIREYYKHRREEEKDADDYGLQIIKQSRYSLSVARNYMVNSIKPYTCELSDEDLRLGTYKMPPECLQLAQTIFEDSVATEIRDYVTHPLWRERLVALNNYLGNDNIDKEPFRIIGEDQFQRFKQQCAMLNLKEFNNKGLYHMAFWKSHNLNHSSRVVIRNRVRSLYELGALRSVVEGDFLSNYRNPTNINLYALPSKDILAFALIETFSGLDKFPDDLYLQNVKADILHRLLPFGLNRDFTEYVNGTAHIQRRTYYTMLLEYLDQHRELISLKATTDTRSRFDSIQRVTKSTRFNTGIGVKKLLMVDPIWAYYDNKEGAKQIYSEHKTIEYLDLIKQNAQYAGMQIQILSPKSIAKDQADVLNDYFKIMDWVNYRNIFSTYVGFVYPEPEEIIALAKKYDCDHVCQFDVSTFRRKKSFGETMGWIAQSALIVNAPLTLYQAFKAEFYSRFDTWVIDMHNGNIAYVDHNMVKINTTRGVVNSYMYAYFKTFMKNEDD